MCRVKESNRSKLREPFPYCPLYGKCDIIDARGWAVQNQEQDAVLLLLNNDADLNATDCSGKTNLHWSAYVGNHTIDISTPYFVDVNTVNKNGETPLATALYCKHVKTIEALVARDGDIWEIESILLRKSNNKLYAKVNTAQAMRAPHLKICSRCGCLHQAGIPCSCNTLEPLT